MHRPQIRWQFVNIVAVALLLAAQTAQAAFSPPAGWTRGSSLSTYQGWDSFNNAEGAPPNAPDLPGLYNPAAPGGAGLNVYDASGMGFLTGDQNIYSFSDPTEIHAKVPNYALGNNYYTLVFAQTRTIGSEIDYAHVAIGTAAPVYSQELSREPYVLGFGDTFLVDHLYKWVFPTNAASYDLFFPASGSSMSFDAVAIDTLTVLAGDANRDNKVNAQDIALVASKWLNVGAIGALPGDANFDGVVNAQDIGIVASHWLAVGPGGGGSGGGGALAAVPEPSAYALALAGAGLLVVAATRKRMRKLARG